MKKVLFLVAMTIGMAATAANYIQVTQIPADWTGTYLIVCKSQSVVFNGGAAEDDMDAKGGAAILTSGFSFNGDTLVGSLTVDTATFTIAATDDIDWPWSIQSYSGYFIGHKDTADNGLSVETEVKKKCRHTLAIEDGNLIATPRHEVSEAYNLQYNKKADQQRFRYFVPEDKVAIQIYKLVDEPTGLEQNEVVSSRQVRKIVRNGQLLIIKDGQEFSVLGK